MTYVTEQTSAELRAHMRRLKAMAGWHEPLADRLFKEIVAQDEEIADLKAALAKATPALFDDDNAALMNERDAKAMGGEK